MTDPGPDAFDDNDTISVLDGFLRDPLIRRERMALLDAVLRTMIPLVRELVLRYLNGETPRELAAQYNMTPRTVSRLLSRAIEQIEAQLGLSDWKDDPGPSDKLRQRVLEELQRQKRRAAPPHDRPRLLGAFLEACLNNRGRTPADFARALDIEQELADAILEGILPESELDDEFLVEIARAVDYEPNVLRAMLGRGERQSKAKVRNKTRFSRR